MRSMNDKQMKDALDMAKTLLRATYDILKKQDDTPYVQNVLCLTAIWDGEECDGYCLKDDISYWFDEFMGEELPE